MRTPIGCRFRHCTPRFRNWLPSYFSVLFICAVCWLHSGGPAAAQDSSGRAALLIANGAYPDASPPIQSVARDAAALADELKLMSFDITQAQNATKQDMQGAMDGFLRKIKPGTTALVYFGGIGIQIAHQTFLIPVNAEIWSETDVKREGVSIDWLVGEMNQRGAKVKIVILDASRRNPFERRFRTYSAGLAGVDAPEGTLVIFSAAPNKVSRDNSSDAQTLFMTELVKELDVPGIGVEEAMTRTRIGVSRASGGEEVPWMASSLIDPVYFTPPSAQGDQASAPPPSPRAPVPAAPAPQETVLPPPPAPVQQPAERQPPPAAPDRVANAPSPKPSAPGNRPPAPEKSSDQPAVGTPIRDCPDCPQLVVVPAGDFTMGSGTTPYDRPPHKVIIAKPFAIGRTEVTFAEWDRCVSDGGCKYRPDDQSFGGGDHPVINISWFDTKDYIAWLSEKTGKTYRLPSEAEWEFAAHGGTTTAYTWGNEPMAQKANCSDCGNDSDGRQTVPVASYPANGYGLFDMAGNAAEWVEDCWIASYRGAPRDATPREVTGCGQRVLRGGSFDASSAYAKPTARFRYDADVRYWANGFRLLRELP